MATFVYEALDATGRPIRGQVDAETQAAGIGKLQGLNYTVLKLNEKRQNILAKQPAKNGRVKLASLVVFSRQFATMINAGISVVKCLDILEVQCKDPALKVAIQEARRDVTGGLSLTEAFAKHPRIFSKLYVSMIKAAEVGGILDTILDRLATFLEKEQEVIGKIKGAMVYPVCVLVFALAMVNALFLFVLPTFKEIFESMNSELPFITKALFFISGAMRSYWFVWLALPIIAIIAFKKYHATERGRWNIDRLKLKLPIIGELVQKMAISRFSRTFGTLVNSGVPVLRALEIVSETAGNVVIQKAVTDARASVREGQKISAPLAESGQFPAMVTQMIDIGEETGRMSEMLVKVAQFYDNEVEVAVKSLTSLIEPALIILLGGIVGFIVSSIMVPMFTMINNIDK